MGGCISVLHTTFVRPSPYDQLGVLNMLEEPGCTFNLVTILTNECLEEDQSELGVK